jgi:hypothetical protein
MPTRKHFRKVSLGDLIAYAYDSVAASPHPGRASLQVARVLRRQLRGNPRARALLFSARLT